MISYNEKSLRLATLEEALSEWRNKVKEEGGENRGKAVTSYLRAAGIGSPAPWCAAFCNAMAERAAAKLKTASPLEFVPLQAYVESYFKYGKEKGWLVPSKDALPGDLILLYYPTLKRHGHIGFVLEMNHKDGYCITVEGNTNSGGSREGDGVYKKKRAINANTKFLHWSD